MAHLLARTIFKFENAQQWKTNSTSRLKWTPHNTYLMGNSLAGKWQLCGMLKHTKSGQKIYPTTPDGRCQYAAYSGGHHFIKRHYFRTAILGPFWTSYDRIMVLVLAGMNQACHWCNLFPCCYVKFCQKSKNSNFATQISCINGLTTRFWLTLGP